MEPFALIIFGATGNLTQLKLIPALYGLEKRGLLHEKSSIIGIGRRAMSKPEFENHLTLNLPNVNPQILKKFLGRTHYLQADFEKDPVVYGELKKLLASRGSDCDNHLYYLATYPSLYPGVFLSLKKHELTKSDCGWIRLMIEKPLGHDLASAKDLDNILHEHFSEDQIFRLDHYLGKETLQNILAFRFGNSLLSSVMNREHIDHIQVTIAEEIGIGKRGGYYDPSGAFLDVGQSHLLQMLVAVTMEAPAEFSNEAITRERIKILKSLRPDPKKIVFGQYNGYLYEDKVAKESKTDTFFALKTEVDNDRWRGVPIYLRAGKKLPQNVAEISVVFKAEKSSLFGHHDLASLPNILTYRLQPNEGIGIEISTKKPGHKFLLDRDYLQFCYRKEKNEPPEAYEKLILDAITGDQTFFNDWREVEISWKFIDQLTVAKGQPKVYEPGTWGPQEANKLIEADGRKWLEPSSLLCRL